MKKAIYMVIASTLTFGTIAPAHAQVSSGRSVSEQTILKLKAEETVQKLSDLVDRRRAIEKYMHDTKIDAVVENGLTVVGGALGGAYVGQFASVITDALQGKELDVKAMERSDKRMGIGAIVGAIVAFKVKKLFYTEAYNSQWEVLPNMSPNEISSEYQSIQTQIQSVELELDQVLALEQGNQ